MDNKSNLLIDGYTMAACVKAGAARLEKNEKLINQLNVFPVPDGDTGTNMLNTLRGGIQSAKNTENLGEYMASLSKGMLFGARGNSGVIFSMIFSGIAEGLEGIEKATATQLRNALENGAKVAYSSVSKPTEGTILTVAREGAEKIDGANLADTIIWDFFKEYIGNIRDTLDKTPDLLPILKSAGVVDSGGFGFVKFFEGFTEAAVNAVTQDSSEDEYNALLLTGDISSKWLEDSEEDAFGFCTECIILLDDATKNVRDEADAYLNSMGQSVVCVQKDEILKMHVHTLEPIKVLQHMQETYGTFYNVKIENMDTMFLDRLNASKNTENSRKTDAQDEEDGITAEINIKAMHENLVHESHAGITFVSVANGEGLAEIFHENGCEFVINGGQTMNTSVEEFVETFEKCDTTDIVVMPNNSNIEAAARQAANLYTQARVHIVPTHSIAEGYFAMSMVTSYDDGAEALVDVMTAGMANVDTVWISKAIRDAVVDNTECHMGDFLALLGKDIIATNTDRFEAAKKALENVPDIEDKYIAVIFKGKDASMEEAEQLKEFIEDTYGIDSGIFDGGQDVYDYIVGICG
ncbi:MAG: DAK2 domain-containing protein [Lachnospiraceae bacterium]|nr:DAK2 domain-containing protein [Lachnospiraceae bacterium]